MLGLSAAPVRGRCLAGVGDIPIDKAACRTEALKAISAGSRAGQGCGGSRILVSGFTDTSGSAAHNTTRQETRVWRSANALIKAGLPEAAIC